MTPSEWKIEEGLASGRYRDHQVTLEPITLSNFKKLLSNTPHNRPMLIDDQLNNAPPGTDSGLVLRVTAPGKPNSIFFMAAPPDEPPMTLETITDRMTPADILRHYTDPEPPREYFDNFRKIQVDQHQWEIHHGVATVRYGPATISMRKEKIREQHARWNRFVEQNPEQGYNSLPAEPSEANTRVLTIQAVDGDGNAFISQLRLHDLPARDGSTIKLKKASIREIGQRITPDMIHQMLLLTNTYQ